MIKINNNIKEFFNKSEVKDFYHEIKGAYHNYKISNSNLWVSSLCYYTIMSFIPVLAIAFSFGKWLGVEDYLFDQLARNSPLNKEYLDLLLKTSQNLLENTRGGVIAGVGFISLGWVIISMFSTIEKALNSIWGIRKDRSFFRKFSDYTTVFCMLPLSVLGSNILQNFRLEILFLPKLIDIFVPYLSLWIFFIIFYSVLPNTKVKLFSVIWSGFIVSFLLSQSNFVLIKLQTVIIKYNTIYGSFSILLIFLIWLKYIWFLILLGAHFSYILQNREELKEKNIKNSLSFSSKFEISKKIVLILGENYFYDNPPITLQEISERLKISKTILKNIISDLIKINYVIEVNDEERTYKIIKNIYNLDFEILEKDLKNLGENYEFEKSDYDLIKLNPKIKISEIIKSFD